MFNLSKKKVTSEEMASIMYMLFVRNVVKGTKKDIDGNIILDKNEQQVLLLSHVCDLLDVHDLKDVKLQLLSIFANDNRNVRSEADLIVEMAVLANLVKKISNFFKNIPAESHEFFGKTFLFDKKLNPMQETLALSWYVEHSKAIDSVFESTLNKFELQPDPRA